MCAASRWWQCRPALSACLPPFVMAGPPVPSPAISVTKPPHPPPLILSPPRHITSTHDSRGYQNVFTASEQQYKVPRQTSFLLLMYNHRDVMPRGSGADEGRPLFVSSGTVPGRWRSRCLRGVYPLGRGQLRTGSSPPSSLRVAATSSVWAGLLTPSPLPREKTPQRTCSNPSSVTWRRPVPWLASLPPENNARKSSDSAMHFCYAKLLCKVGCRHRQLFSWLMISTPPFLGKIQRKINALHPSFDRQ